MLTDLNKLILKMIKISKSGNSILVEGLDNVFYPDNGKLTFPSNSLILTIDESNMATFRSAANNDVMFSGLIEDMTISDEAVTKADIISKFGVVAYSTSGGGGGTGAVSSVNGQTGDVVITAASIDAATNSEVTSISNRVDANQKNIANNSGLISALEIGMMKKQNKLTAGENITLSEPDPNTGNVTISATGGSGGSGVTSVNGQTGEITLEIPTAQDGDKGSNNNYIWSNSNQSHRSVITNIFFSQVDGQLKLQNKKWGDLLTTYGTNVPSATAENAGVMSPADKTKLDAIPSMSVLTQSEYDALATKDVNTLYFIKEG